MESRFEEFSKKKTSQLSQLRKDFLNTRKRSEILNTERLKLLKKVESLEEELKKSKSKAKIGNKKLKKLKKDVKTEIAEIKKEVELKEVETFEKDIQCNLLDHHKTQLSV